MELKKQDKILIENVIDKLKKGKYTKFLDERELNIVLPILNKEKISYNIYKTFNDCNYYILYSNLLPKVSILRINCKKTLRHQDIMGSVYNLGIDKAVIGDIIVDEYNDIIVLDYISDYIINNLLKIGKYEIEIIKVNIDKRKDYIPQYLTYNKTVASNRIDVVISKVINTSRSIVEEKIKNKEIFLNYEILKEKDYKLKEGDIFSIRKYGKYKFLKIVKTTKKNNLLIEYLKYN